MAKKNTVKLGGNAIPSKEPKQKKPSKQDLKQIQEGLNAAGQQALETAQSPEMQKASEIMARRLGKIDKFIDQLVKEEGQENLSPQQVTELLMIKARHHAFIHCAEPSPEKVLVWLIELILFSANAIFSVTKAHLVAEKAPENAEIPQKEAKKSRKKA